MIEGIIYCAISPSNKKYYGFSLNFEGRKSSHYKNAFKEKRISLFYNAIRKYGFENFQWNIIEEHQVDNKDVLKKLLSEREIYWIEKDKTYLKEYGYNMTMGGNGGSPTEEVKKRISKKLKGIKRSEEFIEKQRQSHKGSRTGEKCNFISYIKENRKGKSLKEEMINMYGEDEGLKRYNQWTENMRNAKLGSKLSEKHKENIGKSMKGRKRTLQEKENIKLGWIKRKENQLKIK